MTKKKNVEAIAEKMQEAWLNFARYGNPNKVSEDNWKKYNTTDYPIMIFDNKCQFVCDPDQKQRKAWEVIGY